MRHQKSIFKGIALILGLWAVWAGQPTAYAEPAKPQLISAVVTKVEGKGTANVRRKSGITTVAGQGLKIFIGDKVITDTASQVELALVDGTLIKIGLNSEYRFDAAQPKKDFVTYVFSLAKGSIRALVEKRQEKKSVKFRVNTPSGTMGVRGTEILLRHDPSSETSSLFLLEGMADFGKPQCEKTDFCIVVKTAHWSSIKKGQEKPSPPQPFGLKDLSGGDEGASKKDAKATDVSLLGLLGLNPETMAASKIEEKDLKALLEKASEDMKRAQDALLGRNEALRKAMDAAKANGTFDQYMKLAEKYDDLKRKKTGNRAGESYSGAISSKKFALASSILKTGKVKLSDSKEILSEKTAPLEMKTTSGTEVKTVESVFGGDVTAKKVEEANKIAEQLGSLSTANSTSTQTSVSLDTSYQNPEYQTGTAKYTVETLDQGAVAVLEQSKEISSDYKEYVETYTYYEKCGFQETKCGDFQDSNGYWYVKKTGETTMTETKIVSRTGSACYEVRKVCGNVLQPCDLSKGTFCTPVLKYQCTEEKKTVTCPK